MVETGVLARVTVESVLESHTHCASRWNCPKSTWAWKRTVVASRERTVTGFFGQAANGLSFVMSLLGTSFIIRRFGLNFTLILFPVFCLGAIVLVYARPGASDLEFYTFGV